MHYAPQTVDGIVTYPTIMTIDNSDLKLRPGMTASADITVEHVEGVLTVPNAAFRYLPPVASVSTQKTTGLLGMLFSGGGPGGGGDRTSTATETSPDGYRNLYVLKDGAPVQVAVKTGSDGWRFDRGAGGAAGRGDLVVTAQTTGSK